MLAAAAVLGGTAGAAFFALGLTLPGLLLQDSWRYSFFALGRGSQAFLNDTSGRVTLLPSLVLLRDRSRGRVLVRFRVGRHGGRRAPPSGRCRPGSCPGLGHMGVGVAAS